MNITVCNQDWPAAPTTTWTDNCSGGGTITGVSGPIMNGDDGCSQYRIYTFNVDDECGNAAEEVTVKVTRYYDETAPEITPLDDVNITVCNQDWPAAPTTTWTDNCSGGGTITGVSGPIMNGDDGCSQYRIYTFNVDDECGNAAEEVTVKVTRYYDETAPEITPLDDVNITVCNQDWPAAPTTTWTDNCSGGGTITGVSGPIMNGDDGCSQYRIYTFNVDDECGNAAEEVTVKVTRYYDETAPEITPLDDVNITVCNQDWPAAPTTTWTDNCSGGGTITGVSGPIMNGDDGCSQYRIYTFNVDDECGNAAEEVTVKVTRYYDETAPEITPLDDVNITVCNQDWPAAPTTTWTDNCSGGGTITGVSGPIMNGDDGCSQYRIYTFNVDDECGNAAEEVTVKVTRYYDETAPEITPLDDVNITVCNQDWPAAPTTTWTDNCSGGGTITGVSGPIMNGDDGCSQYRIYTFNVDDECGNAAEEVTVKVTRYYDETAPEITPLDDVNITVCNQDWPAAPTTTWTDNCSGGGTITGVSGPIMNGDDGCSQYRIYTFNVDDECGNAAEEVTVKVTRYYDETAPEITPLDDVNITVCNQDWPAAPTTTWTDNCSGGGTITGVSGPIMNGDDGCSQYRIYTFNVDDECGNAAEEVTVKVTRYYDETAPEITPLDDVNITVCNQDWPAAPTTTWTDNCSGGGTITGVSGPIMNGDDGCSQYRIYTFNVDDECGNAAEEVTVKVTRYYDETAPEITPLDDVNITVCNQDWPAAPTTTWTDNCSGGGTITGVSGPIMNGDDGCSQYRIYTFNVDDECGNAAEEVTVKVTRYYDETAPEITPLDDVNITVCNQDWPAAPTTTWTDNCSGGGTITGVSGPIMNGDDGCSQYRIYTFNVDDECGNAAEEVTVKVTRYYDETAPEITPLDDVNITVCNQDWPAAPTTTWTDNCSGGGTITGVSGPIMNGDDGCSQYRIYTFNVDDECGNAAEEVTVKVTRYYDETAPEITPLDDVNITVCNQDWPAAPTTTWTDNCSGGGTITGVSGPIMNGDDGCSQYRIYTFNVDDECGNAAEEVTVKVTRYYDETAPEITPLDDVNITVCNQDWPAAPTTTWTDNCSGGGTITGVSGPIMNGDDGCSQYRIYTFNVDDECGNAAEEVTVKVTRYYDETAPEITPLDDVNITVCNQDWPAAPTTTWTDNCSGGGTITGVSGPIMNGDDGCSQYRIYTFNVDDECGNAAEEVTVKVTRYYDETAPEITPLDDVNITVCNQDWPAAPTTTWTDNCSGGGTITGVSGPIMNGDDGCSQYRIYTFNVDDECGNAAEEVTVKVTRYYDETAPEITPLDDVNITVCNQDWPAAPTTTWTDNCSGGGTITGVSGPIMNGDDGCSQYRIYTFNVDDECGNAAEEVTVKVTRYYDETAPEITPLDDVNITVCNQDWPAAPTTTWTDNCSGGGTITGVSGPIMNGDDGCSQYRIYTFNVDDECGNAAEEVTVKVTRYYDETAPEITPLDDVNITVCNQDWPAAPTTTWTDNCSGGGTITGVSGPIMNGDDGCSQYRIYTFNVDDECGNAAEEVTVKVTRYYDETAPEITPLDDVNITVCNQDWPAAPTTTWTDNCSGGGTITGVSGPIMNGDDGCSQYRIYTFNVDDECGNAAEEVTEVVLNEVGQSWLQLGKV